VPSQEDRRAAFSDRFAALVRASGLSTRDIERQTRVSRSAVSDWQSGRSLPQVSSQLEDVVKVLLSAAGDSANARLTARALTSLLRDATEERDAHSVRRPDRVTRRDPGLQAERRARAALAAAKAKKAFMSLRNLDTMPDWRYEVASYTGKDTPQPSAEEETAKAAWKRQREDLLSEIELAIYDIDDEQLRVRLREAVEMVRLWNGPMRHMLQGEHQTRRIVVADALEALGAYGRGDPLPARSAEYGNTKEFVDLYIEEWEINSGR
jgi:transcriptional regulator with XRE-family HTH domain